jgi:uncharacterized protein (TIGR03083 family)
MTPDTTSPSGRLVPRPGGPRLLSGWLERHQHPVSFYLHLAGIPMTLLAAPALVRRRFGRAAGLFGGGYALQFVGHLVEGNPPGEVVALRRRLTRNRELANEGDTMTTASSVGSYDAIVDALDEALQALQATLTGLTDDDWTRPTLLKPATPDAPPWTVLELAAHMDVFMGIALGLMAEPTSDPPGIDAASFCIASSDGSQGPMLYQYMADHAAGQTPATMLETVQATFKQALASARTTPPDTVGPAFYGLIRLDEFLATRVAEAVIHGLDLTDALGRPALPMPNAVPIAAAVLDEVLARTRVAGRPADLAGDDLAFIRAASGRGEHPDPRFPVVR